MTTQTNRPGLRRTALALGLMASGFVVGCTREPAPGSASYPATRFKIQQISQTIGPGGEIFQQVGGLTQRVGGGGVFQQFPGGTQVVGGDGTTSWTSGGGTSTVMTGGGAFSSSTVRTGNREEIVQSFAVSGPRTLDISNLNGNITLHPGASGTMQVRITKEALGDPNLLDQVNVSTSVAGPVALRTVATDPNVAVRVHYDIAVPSGVSLGTIQTGSGNITLSGLRGGTLLARNGTVTMN